MSVMALLMDILFVGHSLVGPSLPPMIEAGLAKQGLPAAVSAQVINGAPLRFGWENSREGERADARAVLPRGATDILILTEATPIAAQVEWNDTAEYVAKFAGLAWQARPDTQVYIYETWPSLNSGTTQKTEADAGVAMPWRERLTADLPLWEGATAAANAARPNGAPLVRLIPAGQAMGRLADAIAAGEMPEITNIDALFDDDIHPDDRALYFLAMVHIAVITGQDPRGLPAKLTRHWISRSAAISDAQAAAFQRIAWTAVNEYRADDLPRIEALARAAAPNQPAALAAPTVVAPIVSAPAIAAEPAPEPAPAPVVVAQKADSTAAPPDLPRAITNPRLSLGLASVVDWSVQQPFLDVMKTARPWIGQVSDAWGGVEYDALRTGGYLDANGWPKAFPPDVVGISTLVLTDLPTDAGKVAGSYVLRYSGKGQIKLAGRAESIAATPGAISFDYTPGPGSVVVTVSALDAADPIRDISVVRADHLAAFDGGALFNPDWLARIRGVKGLRFMDWMATNNSTLTEVQDRPKPSDFSWAVNGVPVEVMVALANELRSDAWFTIPHLASDALVRYYATVVHDGLAPGLHAQVEYSNEVWNWQFTQAAWADAQCRARWKANDCWVQYYGMRAAEVADIWADVFGDSAKTRLTRVISTQTGWIGLEDQILDAPLSVAEGHKKPVDSFDAYAVTGYFSAGLGSDDRADMLQGWLADSRAFAAANADKQGLTGQPRADFVTANRFDLATNLAASELENGAVTGQVGGSLSHLVKEVLPHHAAVAKQRGLTLMMYEGGTHVVANGGLLDDSEITAFFQHLNYSRQMGTLYDHLLAGWSKLTPAPFNAFVDVYAPSKWGSWGGLRHLGDDNPRWQVLARGCTTC
jgi:hypothetical protein